jgi:hypothetical protein
MGMAAQRVEEVETRQQVATEGCMLEVEKEEVDAWWVKEAAWVKGSVMMETVEVEMIEKGKGIKVEKVRCMKEVDWVESESLGMS